MAAVAVSPAAAVVVVAAVAGKRADFVVFDRNLFEIPTSEISEATVLMTIFDGRTVYKRTPD